MLVKKDEFIFKFEDPYGQFYFVKAKTFSSALTRFKRKWGKQKISEITKIQFIGLIA